MTSEEHPNDVRTAPAVQSEPVTDAVETALAGALTAAVAAGQWGVVAQLGRELESRRLARAGVPDLVEVRRAKAGG